MSFNVSLFEEISLLIDPDEMCQLLDFLPEHQVIDASAPLLKKQYKKIDLKQAYANYVAAILDHRLLDPKEDFHGKLVIDPTIFDFFETKDGRYLVEFLRPPIYLRHTTAVMDKDKNLKFFVFGPDKIFLGLTFRYPRIYEGKDRVAKKTVGLKEFEAFRQLARWVRQNTFCLKYKNESIGVRVTQQSIRWVKEHFQLKHLFESQELTCN